MASHQEDTKDPKTISVVPGKDEENFVGSDDILKGAQQATNAEHSMTFKNAIRKYPKACAWSFVFSAALIMEGFDKAFVTAFFAFPAFQNKYGKLTADGTYQIPADIQAAISNCVNVGQIIGLLLNGHFADKFGYRAVMLACLFLMMCFVFLQFFAVSIYMYIGAGLLLGIPWGAFQTLTTTYAAEVCPSILRPYLTMLVSLCWSIGYLLGTSVLRGFLQMEGQWAYRIPFALQWVLPIPLSIGVFFAPDSPWWLARRGRMEDAEKALRRLQTNAEDDEIADTMSMIIHTVKLEDENKDASTYKDLFAKKHRRRTEITVMTYVIQELVAPLMSYIVYFLQQAGVPTTASFNFAIGQYSLAIVGVFIAWTYVNKIGRRPIMLWGTLFITVTTFVIGFLGIPDTTVHTNFAYGVGAILLVQYFALFLSVGPIVYTIVTEVPSNFLRIKSVAVARACYNIGVLVAGQLVPRMVQKAAWNWGAKSGFFYGGIMAIGLTWAFFRLPETKGRTFAEIDVLFENKVKARDFAKAKVDLANETVTVN